MKVLPPEIIDSILTVLSYAVTTVLGWFAKLLSDKNKARKDGLQ